MNEKKALLMTDLQNDFCQGGSLEVPDANTIIPIANQLQGYFDVIIASQDWHPKGHVSFASSHPGKKVNDIIMLNDLEQILWPDHCVQGTKGADFHTDLDTTRIDKIVHKGTDKDIDSYSVFFDNARLRETDLNRYLQANKITTLYIFGLATDYCVKYSCCDAIELGFQTFLIEDACRGIELTMGDIVKAVDKMRLLGVKIIQSRDIIK